MSHKKVEKPKLLDHRHCKICARAIPPDEEFCSDKCRQVFEEYRRKERRGRIFFYIVYGILMSLLLVLFVLRPMTSS